MTKVINLIGAPGVGKSTLMAMLFVELKKRNQKCEMVQEWVKKSIWKNELDVIKNQYYLIQQQYNDVKSLYKNVDYIIMDTSLVNYIYYNRTNPDNICNIEKTEQYAKNLLAEFDNVFIYVTRNFKNYYETEGRLHTLEQSLDIDLELRDLVKELNLNVIYFESNSSDEKIKELIKNFLL